MLNSLGWSGNLNSFEGAMSFIQIKNNNRASLLSTNPKVVVGVLVAGIGL